MNLTAPPASGPLNPTLFNFLTHKFKDVRIANQGAAAVTRKVRDPINPKKVRLQGVSWGEYYCVCCPFCNDGNNKLWINHTYAADLDARTGRRMNTHLAVCYKNNCIDSPERREQLQDLIFGPGRSFMSRMPITPGTSDVGPKEIKVPGDIVALSDLPASHPAVTYLTRRGFDPEELSRDFSVGVCAHAKPEFPAMRGRIYIPSFFNRSLVSWQGRIPSEQKVQMKYFTGGTKSRALYNYDVAKDQSTVVIVEGAPSAWRLGCYGVSLFGKTLSYWQENTVATTWVGKPIFVVLDHGEELALTKITDQLLRHNLTVIPVCMPDARDPADYSREQLFSFLEAQAQEKKIDVKF